jgi:hypothetical protein
MRHAIAIVAFLALHAVLLVSPPQNGVFQPLAPQRIPAGQYTLPDLVVKSIETEQFGLGRGFHH